MDDITIIRMWFITLILIIAVNIFYEYWANVLSIIALAVILLVFDILDGYKKESKKK